MEKDCCEEVRIAKYGDMSPIVSVVMIAYNVEQYIAEAIESVLVQKTNFKVELVIGEDCSTDSTLQIALEYQCKYPEVIRVLKREKNLGLTPNCVDTHNHCNGKYIALLDSDDYWTSDEKLQKQIAFLESNPEYSGCAHQSLIIKGSKDNPVREFWKNDDCDLGIQDTISHRKFHTSSLVYRKKIWDKCGGIPASISSNERAIYPMVAIFGAIKYFKENMCVYRITGTGLTSRVDYEELETDFVMLPWLKKIDKNFPIRRFKSFLHLCNYTYGVKELPKKILLKHYFLSVFNSFSYFPNNLGDVKWASVFFLRTLKKTRWKN
jgi:glycosyltransferase involved in cell wall biosynthesis